MGPSWLVDPYCLWGRGELRGPVDARVPSSLSPPGRTEERNMCVDACDSGNRRVLPVPQPHASPPPRKGMAWSACDVHRIICATPLLDSPAQPEGEGPRQRSRGGRGTSRQGCAARSAAPPNPPAPQRTAAPRLPRDLPRPGPGPRTHRHSPRER